MTASYLNETLSRLSACTASSVIARGRIASSALNATLLRRLSAEPGGKDALLADPVFEIARTWKSADCSLGDLSGGLLHPKLVEALAEARTERIPRDRRPWTHQLATWQAAREGFSCLVTSGTGSGKTECFMVPMLDDLLRDPVKGHLTGVRAIVIYPLNALIESQRERLAAWTEALCHRFKFALYNGLTPETKREESNILAAAEIGNRRDIRETPPAILVTNVTMLEYLLLRTQDRPILEQSQGLLRWIVLDEAHSYIGAQAAEMALLLRRVRAAFNVTPDKVRLMATSATISEGISTEAKLKRFVSDLAGLDESLVRIVEGCPVEPELPPVQEDTPLEPENLDQSDPATLWSLLAPHPRVRALKHAMSEQSVTLSEITRVLFGSDSARQRSEAQSVLDAAARAQNANTQDRLLPWRVHIFHRAQGGFWICVDERCKHRDSELAVEGSDWKFGAVWLKQRDKCDCGAPVFELFTCNDCGAPHLQAGFKVGTSMRLVPLRAIETDDFAVDAEPDPENNDGSSVVSGKVILSPARGNASDGFLKLDDRMVFDNDMPQNTRSVRLSIEEDESARACCPGSVNAQLTPQRYGPPFFMGAAIPTLIEPLAQPLDQSGLPMGGRRAITFSDSRQGTARLAAKLQQDAERSLTRAFLYHATQESRDLKGEERAKLEKRLMVYRTEPDVFADEIREVEEKLLGGARPIPWNDLIDRFTQQNELREFATEVWRERARGGREMADDPSKLAKMFLYRELFRRPRVQNNAETMGLLRLSFPELEEKARAAVPRVLAEAGVDSQGWVGLALAAVDFVFRGRLATQITPDWMKQFVSPRSSRQLNSVCHSNLMPADRPVGSTPWLSPIPQSYRPSHLHRLIYALIGGNWDNEVDQDRASQAFTELWSLITSTAAKDIGSGAFQIDFTKAAVLRLDQGWLCPVTRRVFGYSPAERSPYDPNRLLLPIRMPHLPEANAGGLTPDARSRITHWCETDVTIADLRQRGLWTDLHDRVATYTPFLRAQEHSAQIERPVLAAYEDQFKKGQINLLNCSTTMEMGVDIPNVQIVINANVPPSISNYRQRIGRAGRRGEPWAFGMTFCRNLPLDQIVFDKPVGHLLSKSVTAPAVRLDSRGLVFRHVHAALLAAFLWDQPGGFNLRATTGAFFGATEDPKNPTESISEANDFLDALQGSWSQNDVLASKLTHLTRGTVLESETTSCLVAQTAATFETLLKRWRTEYAELLARCEAASEPEVKQAFRMKARRMKGEFLLGELARRGFTPSYGFPVDVVTFDHLSGHSRDGDPDTGMITFGRGGAARTLDVAIREYAPEAEIVIDGLVHRSEGILPAWGAMADASKLEDLQYFWECQACRNFALERIVPEVCSECQRPVTSWNRGLRPAGFLGRRAPHTGYESLGYVPYEMPRLSAAGVSWQILPAPEIVQFRANPNGKMITLGSGRHQKGYALCLVCGRAEAETETGELPQRIRQHRPLASVQRAHLARGYCPGGYTEPQRIQRNIRLIHEVRTDVFELQLPAGTSLAVGLALAAAMREAMTERLGVEAREIGVAVGSSAGPVGKSRNSAFLYDRASGGAGLASRLAEQEWLDACLERASERLSCPEDCKYGCPSCVLRPDLNFFEEDQLDRPGALILARTLHDSFQLEQASIG